jgi:hypothetical protein
VYVEVTSTDAINNVFCGSLVADPASGVSRALVTYSYINVSPADVDDDYSAAFSCPNWGNGRVVAASDGQTVWLVQVTDATSVSAYIRQLLLFADLDTGSNPCL